MHAIVRSRVYVNSCCNNLKVTINVYLVKWAYTMYEQGNSTMIPPIEVALLCDYIIVAQLYHHIICKKCFLHCDYNWFGVINNFQ